MHTTTPAPPVVAWEVTLRDTDPRHCTRYVVAAPSGDREAAIARAREMHEAQGHPVTAALRQVTEVNAPVTT